MNIKSIHPQEIVKYTLLCLTILGFLYSLNYTYNHFDEPKNINLILTLPFVLFLTPYLFLSLYDLKKVESKMQVVPRFLRDIVDNVESGMDLVSSIKNTANNEYTVLNEDIKKLVNQLSWGVNLDDALMQFAKNVGSSNLKRDFLLVIEARNIGGHVEKILRELSQKISIDNLRTSERRSNLASNTFTGYISFIIFLVIIVLVYNNLFVGMVGSVAQQETISPEIAGSDTVELEVDNPNSQMLIYLTLLLLLSYELALLSGFLFGLMQENNIISGAPHVVALVVMTFAAFFFFI